VIELTLDLEIQTGSISLLPFRNSVIHCLPDGAFPWSHGFSWIFFSVTLTACRGCGGCGVTVRWSVYCATGAKGSMIKKICSYLSWLTDPVAPSINPPSIHPTIGLIQLWCHRHSQPLPRNGDVGKLRVGTVTRSGRPVMANDRRHPITASPCWLWRVSCTMHSAAIEALWWGWLAVYGGFGATFSEWCLLMGWKVLHLQGFNG
jgi:hypothetical protein